MVDLEYKGPERRMDQDRRQIDQCSDHEARIRALEKSYDTLVIRIDKYDVTLHGIEKAVTTLQNEMESHSEIMRSHIDLAFKQHEIQEMKMHKDMLIQAMKSVSGLVVLLATGIGTMGWWIIQHLVGGP